MGEIIQEFDLEILRKGPDYENVPLRTLDVNRPWTAADRIFEHFDTERLLLIGLTESTYVNGMTPQQRRDSFDRLLSYPVPALIPVTGVWSPHGSAWRWRTSMTVPSCVPMCGPLSL